MLEAVLVVYSAFIARVEKENHMNIFGVVYHIGYMIILHGNIQHEHLMKTKTTIHGECNYNSAHIYLLIFLWGLFSELLIEMFTPLHPSPAKLGYVPKAQYDVRWSAGVQMSSGLLPFQSNLNTFVFNILWSTSHCQTSGKNNKAVICVVNKNLSKYFCVIWVEVHPFIHLIQ